VIQTVTEPIPVAKSERPKENPESSDFRKLLDSKKETAAKETNKPAEEKPAGETAKKQEKTENSEQKVELTQGAPVVQVPYMAVMNIQNAPEAVAANGEAEAVVGEVVAVEVQSASYEIPANVEQNPVQQTTLQPEEAVQAEVQMVVNNENQQSVKTAEVIDPQNAPELKEGAKLTEGAKPRLEVKAPEEEMPKEQPVFKNVEAAPIKVAEPEAVFKADTPAKVEVQIQDKLTAALANGETAVQLQLEPNELGAITVEIIRSETGAMRILMSAENIQVQRLLEKNAPALQAALAERGYQEVDIQVQQEGHAEESGRDDYYDGQNGHQDEPKQERKQEKSSDEDFLHKLRLGLAPVGEEQ